MDQRRTKRLLLRNDLSELPRLARWIEERMKREGSPRVAFAVALCLEEAVANIIMHSGAKTDRLKIAVEVARAGQTWTARIEDKGRRFDPTALSPPAAGSLKDARVGDCGLHLMRSFASDMRYERSYGRNCLTLRFFEPKETTSRGARR